MLPVQPREVHVVVRTKSACRMVSASVVPLGWWVVRIAKHCDEGVKLTLVQPYRGACTNPDWSDCVELGNDGKLREMYRKCQVSH